MKLDADNPKLTAYALGELDETERSEMEAQLAGDAAARALVEEIRASAQALSAEFHSEAAAGLSPKHLARIDARLRATPLPRPRFTIWKPVALAASLLFVVGIVGMMVATPVAKRVAMDSQTSLSSPARVMVKRPENPNQYATDDSRAALLAPSDSISTEAASHEILVPPEILSKAEFGDHTEAINLQDVPDNPSQFRPSNRDAAGGGGVGGLDDTQFRIATTKGAGGGWGGGAGTGGDKGNGIANWASKKKVPPKVTATETQSTAPVAAPDNPIRKEVADNTSKGGINYYIKGHEAKVKVDYDFVDETGKKSAMPAKTPPSANEQEEIEKLKKDVAALRLKLATQKELSSSTVDKALEDQYGPNALVSVKAGKLAISGVENAWKEKTSPIASVDNAVELTLQPPPATNPGGETYPAIAESGFKRVTDEPLSTFSIDVDTASYANVRRYLNQGQLPPRDAVRIEEMLNYFSYNYGEPTGSDPFAIHVEIADCPWNTAHRLARVGIKGREFPENKRPAGNYVFLVDVSGSMDDPKRLPLVQAGLNMLVDKLGENDRVGIVTYAGESGIPLRSTSCSSKAEIKRVISCMKAAGSTNGGDGIQKAYKMATENFIKGGVNRVILCTDGDFNVGVTDPNDLVKMIEEQSKSGVFLSVLGFGMGNLKDATMQKLADKGNGNYAYIDTLDEVRKVLIDQMAATLITIAKDVKIQVEFNPAQAGAYRLIGYEKRALAKQDFNNDKVDAGEVGAGHQITALYEIVLAAAVESEPGVDPLIYQKNPERKPAPGANAELLTLKIRYKQHAGETSKLIKGAVTDSGASYSKASKDFKFAAAVAAFGMLLRQSPYRGNTSLDAITELADEARGKDEGGYRREFLGLVEKAKAILKR